MHAILVNFHLEVSESELIETKESAEAYLEGEFYQWMSRSGLLSNLEARHFRVSDEPSAAFGTPSVPLGPAA